jgi:hypothetical protein
MGPGEDAGVVRQKHLVSHEVIGNRSGARHPGSGGRGHVSRVMGQESGVRGQGSRVRGQESWVRSQGHVS